jgi:chaperonin cofactor prefoldin
MDTGGLILIVGALAAAAGAFIWLAFKLENATPQKNGKSKQAQFTDAAEEDVEHIFNDDFREELRNRGRLHFEKIIGDNAIFLQQDLRNTTTQLNEYMESIQKTVQVIEQQRQYLEKQLQDQSTVQKDRIIARFETEMASIFNHYIIKAVGNQIDLSDQLDFILSELESNKQAIIEDIKHGTS